MKVNPLKWAAIGAVACALFATIAQVSGNPMPGGIDAAGCAGLFWGYFSAWMRNRGLH